MKCIIMLFTPDKRNRNCVVEFVANQAPCDNLYRLTSVTENITRKEWEPEIIMAHNHPKAVDQRIAAVLNGRHADKEKELFKKKAGKIKKRTEEEDLDMGGFSF